MSYTLKLSIPEGQLDRIKRQLSAGTHIAAYDKAVGQSLARSVRTIVGNTPKRTGLLRKSWAAGFRRIAPLSYKIENVMPYAEAVEYGAKPRVIVPKNKPFLAWKSAVSMSIKTRRTKSMWVFAKRVNWPGFPGRFMLKKSLDPIGRALTAALTETVRKLWA